MKAAEAYGIKGNNDKSAVLEVAHTSLQRNEIVFSAGSRGVEYTFLLHSIIHEEAHRKDWETNRALTLEERMTLAQEVIDRVNSPDRFKSAYVEEINNSSKVIQLYDKAVEYYAEITAAYFDSAGFLLPEKDKQIVEQVNRKADPTFERSERRRTSAAVGMLSEHHYQKTESVVRDPTTGREIVLPTN